ncbi:MAG: glycosyltransferase family 4 protein, partial [Fibrobacterota bacterium]
ITVIYNGCDLTFYRPAEKQAEEHRGMTFLWIGRIQQYKGIIDALKAFRRISQDHPEAVLHIAGKGPFEEEARRWVAQHRLEDSIHFLGFISDEQKRREMQQARAVLQTSYKEGWGLTVIEANACGTPVIANNAPGLCDSVRDGETGLLYRFGDVHDLAEKMDLLLTDAGLHADLAAQCRPWAEHFTWAETARRTQECIEGIWAQRFS